MSEEIENLENEFVSEESRKNSLILKWALGILGIFILLFAAFFIFYINSEKNNYLNGNSLPGNVGTSSQLAVGSTIDVMADPIQEPAEDSEQIVIQASEGQVLLTPMAEYSVSAKVMSATNYTYDWQAEFEPTDLALAWGELTDPEFGKGIEYSQSGRWYYYYYDSTYKGDKTYIIEHSSNHHIIPASDAIKRAARKIRTGQKVKIDGYLVNVRYVTNKGEYTQNSSLTRSDSGDGACEVLYVNKLQVEDKVYQ